MKTSTRHGLLWILLATSALAALPAQSQKTFRAESADQLKALRSATPYQDNNGAVPPPSVYSGPLFKLNHGWPTQPLPPVGHTPWQAAIGNKPITPQNAAAYAAALKAAVTPNGRNLIMHYDTWNAAKAGWYNEPWLGSQREAIHGTYEAGDFTPSTFPGTGLRAEFNTWVVTYYDARAAFSLFNFWNASAMKPNLDTRHAQFQEGSIIVKAAAFTSDDPKMQTNWWDSMKGAQPWSVYVPVAPQSANPQPPPQLWTGYVAQFDIIVKDTQSAPDTGWVFMTLVYDANAPGDVWDKMVPLGVQWGNDPQAAKAGMPLTQNWINPKAPKYSTQTLGWGGRLSGPNDGAVNAITVGSQALPAQPNSSCMSCHSTSEWSTTLNRPSSFLLPSIASSSPPYFQTCDANGKVDPQGAYICSPAPGSPAWMKWFQNRPGTVAMDPGNFATDFDEVFAFKSLKLWWASVGPKTQPLPLLTRPPAGRAFNLYTGAPLAKR